MTHIKVNIHILTHTNYSNVLSKMYTGMCTHTYMHNCYYIDMYAKHTQMHAQTYTLCVYTHIVHIPI